MRVVAFDTSTEYLSVCLYDSEAGVLALRSREGPLRHGANLAPLLSEILEDAGTPAPPFQGIHLVACIGGPGSFTGLRIGFATAKGLAAASDGALQMVAVPTLEALARRRTDFDGVVLPLLDARKGRFYTALFREGKRLTEDMDLNPAEILDLLAGGAAMTTGFHAPLFRERISAEAAAALIPDPEYLEPLAPTLARMAVEAQARGEVMAPGTGPRYVRRSDAELGRQLG